MKIGPYEVRITVRANARRMILRCRPQEGVVTLTVPRGTTEAEARAMVERNMDWLRENMGGGMAWQPSYAPGERHWCLGRQVTLGRDAPAGEKAYAAWRDRQLEGALRRLLDKWMPRLGIPAGKVKRITLRAMTSRWGSCCPARGTMTFNKRLAYYDESLIEETVVHELCHFFHMNHSPVFYAMMRVHLPDWAARKEKRSKLDVRPLPPVMR